MNAHNQSPIAKINQPEEEAVVGGSGQGCNGIEALVCILALVHPLSSNLKIIILVKVCKSMILKGTALMALPLFWVG